MERQGAAHSIKATRPGAVPDPEPVKRRVMKPKFFDPKPRPRVDLGPPEPGSAGAWGTRNQNPVRAKPSKEWKESR